MGSWPVKLEGGFILLLGRGHVYPMRYFWLLLRGSRKRKTSSSLKNNLIKRTPIRQNEKTLEDQGTTSQEKKKKRQSCKRKPVGSDSDSD